MQPRLIRLRDAPIYLGMDRNRFNHEVRPQLTEIPIGEQGIAFDRLDLDAWVEHYKECNGRPAQRRQLWDAKNYQGSTYVEATGTLIKQLTDSAFAKALAQAASRKRKDI